MNVLAKEEILARAHFKWFNVNFTFRRFDGTVSRPIQRIVFERGDSVGMLLHDLPRDEIVLVEQLRIATAEHGSGLLLEIPAGVLDSGEQPEQTAAREIQEETGAGPTELQPISTFYLSPGACSERIHLFYAPYPKGLKIAEHAGLAEENEDIKVHRVPFIEAMEMVEDGRIADAKTIVALYWLRARN